MTLLLAADQVELYPAAAGSDSHGWTMPGSSPSWCGGGNLQKLSGFTDPGASAAGGHGPHNPARFDAGNLFLPIEAQPTDGMGALIRGEWYVLGQVRLVIDPTDPSGELGISCWASTVTEAPRG